jgi:ribosomal protein L31
VLWLYRLSKSLWESLAFYSETRPALEDAESIQEQYPMKIHASALLFTLLFATPLFARDKSDILVMNNGDRLTGEIKGLSSGTLYVSFDYILGTSSVNWTKVNHLESKQLFIVRTEGGSVYTGTLKTTERAGERPAQIEIASESVPAVVVDQPQIVDVNQTADRFLQRFNGDINLGTTYTKGNQATQYNFSSSVEYPRPRWGLRAAYQSTLSSSTGSTVTTRNAFSLDGERFLRWNNWFYAGNGTLRQSSEQHIDLQTNIGGGIGRYLKNTNRATISLLGGLGWQNTKYSQTSSQLGTQDVAGALIIGKVNLFQFDKTTLTITGTAFPALSQPGRVYFDTNVTYYVKLWADINWNTSFYGNWDTRPPANFPGSDYGISSGLGWTFGNK